MPERLVDLFHAYGPSADPQSLLGRGNVEEVRDSGTRILLRMCDADVSLMLMLMVLVVMTIMAMMSLMMVAMSMVTCCCKGSPKGPKKGPRADPKWPWNGRCGGAWRRLATWCGWAASGWARDPKTAPSEGQPRASSAMTFSEPPAQLEGDGA